MTSTVDVAQHHKRKEERKVESSPQVDREGWHDNGGHLVRDKVGGQNDRGIFESRTCGKVKSCLPQEGEEGIIKNWQRYLNEGKKKNSAPCLQGERARRYNVLNRGEKSGVTVEERSRGFTQRRT